MSIPAYSTHANETTSYYALSTSTSTGVTSITGSTYIVASPSVGEVVISATGLIPAIASATTVSSAWGAAPYPATPAAGVTAVSYVAPRTGSYLLEISAGFNVDQPTGKAVVNGGSDFIGVGLSSAGPFAIAGSATIFPVNMVASGADYGLNSSGIAQLTAGTTYYLYKYAENISTTLALGADTSGVSIRIVPLC